MVQYNVKNLGKISPKALAKKWKTRNTFSDFVWFFDELCETLQIMNNLDNSLVKYHFPR